MSKQSHEVRSGGSVFRSQTNKIGDGENVVAWQMHERTATADAPEH